MDSTSRQPRPAPRWEALVEALADERAVTAIEYALMGALIAVSIVGAVTLAGSSLAALYQYWSSAVVAAL